MWMRKLRKHMSLFLWFAVIIFVLFIFFDFGSNIRTKSRGMVSQGLIGKVNGQPLSYQEFEKNLTAAINKERENRGVEELNPIIQKHISDEIFNQMVMKKVVEELIKKRKIMTTEKEITLLMQNSPPSEILQDSSFWNGKNFNYEKYYKVLSDPRNAKWVNEYKNAIKTFIPQAKLKAEAFATERVTRMEAYLYAYENIGKVQYEYYDYPAKRFVPKSVSNQEIEGYYNIHKEEFRVPQKTYTSYTTFPVKPMPEDENIVKENAESIVKEAKKGTPFSELAKEFSEDKKSKENGGEVGWVTRNQIQKSMVKKVFSLKKGEISEPLRGTDGYYIFKVEGKKRGKIKIRFIFLSVSPSMDTYLSVKTKAMGFIKDYEKVGSEAVKNYGITLKSISIKKGELPPFSLDYGQFFRNPKKGNISPPLVGEDGFYIFIIDSIVPSYIPSLKQIMPQVKEKALLSKGLETAYNIAKKEREWIKKGRKKSIRGIYRKTGLKKLVDLPPEIEGVILSLKKGKLSPPIKVDNSVYIINLLKKIEPDRKTLQDSLNVYIRNILNQKESTAWIMWLNNVKSSIKLEDYRSELQM